MLQITTLTLARRTTGELFASATGVDFTVGTTAAGLSVIGASFALLLQPDGTFALRAAGSVSLSTPSAGLTVAGTLAVEANTTGRDVDLAVADGDPIDLAVLAGITRIGGSLTVTIGTLATITGSFAVEQSTAGPDRIVGTADDVAELLIGATGVSLQVGVGSGGDFIGVQVTGGELILLLTAGGFALDARGSAQLVGVPGVTIGGRVGVQRSTLGAAVTRQLTVAGRTLLLDLAAGTSRFGGTGVTLSVAGQTLSGTFSVVADKRPTPSTSRSATSPSRSATAPGRSSASPTERAASRSPPVASPGRSPGWSRSTSRASPSPARRPWRSARPVSPPTTTCGCASAWRAARSP